LAIAPFDKAEKYGIELINSINLSIFCFSVFFINLVKSASLNTPKNVLSSAITVAALFPSLSKRANSPKVSPEESVATLVYMVSYLVRLILSS
jgi:hypothetical protein